MIIGYIRGQFFVFFLGESSSVKALKDKMVVVSWATSDDVCKEFNVVTGQDRSVCRTDGGIVCGHGCRRDLWV